MSLWKKRSATEYLSPYLKRRWGFVRFRYLILATERYIVFIDDELEVDWKSTAEWDQTLASQRREFDAILNRAASVESSDWENSDTQTTIKWKRQIGEAIARGLDTNFAGAVEMLDRAKDYRRHMLSLRRRQAAIKDQVKTKYHWRRASIGWSWVHYTIGICAIRLSTLIASKPLWLNEIQIGFVAWVVAAFTGLLTFLAPDKKADKYIRAWSVLSSEVTRYNTNTEHTVEDVLDACRYGENIIHGTLPEGHGRSKARI